MRIRVNGSGTNEESLSSSTNTEASAGKLLSEKNYELTNSVRYGEDAIILDSLSESVFCGFMLRYLIL